MHELPHPGELRMNECLGALANMTLDACGSRMRPGTPGDELRLHRCVAGGAAELRRLHRVNTAERAEQHDDDVDDGERGNHERRLPHMRDAEVEDRPVLAGPASATLSPREPYPRRDEEKSENQEERQDHEQDDPAVRIVDQAGNRRGGEDEKCDARGRGNHGPG
jgi:hypothetical protein